MDAGLNETRMKIAGEIAELGLVLARDLQQSALAAKETEDKVRLAEAFHRVGRGVRQSLALHAQLERDLERGAPAAEAQTVQADKSRREQRKALVKSTIERLIWTEREKLTEPDYVLRPRLSTLLFDEARAEGFLETDADLVIARICKALRLPSPPAGEGVVRRTTDEGSENLSAARGGAAGATPHPTCSAGHPLPQGERDDQAPFHPSG